MMQVQFWWESVRDMIARFEKDTGERPAAVLCRPETRDAIAKHAIGQVPDHGNVLVNGVRLHASPYVPIGSAWAVNEREFQRFVDDEHRMEMTGRTIMEKAPLRYPPEVM